ncbi:MAG TPA: TonB family protein [Arenimonas sp.]|nr:TonB family protein [Arenimonas sp.]
MRSVIQVGDTVGPFTIIAKLGRGGMSTVYSAYETALDREVALKVLPIDLLEEPGFAERFEREARLIAKLEHPHIVPLYNYGIDDGVPWMALRLVRGGHLGERLERDAIGREAGLAYFTMVADALDHAHSLGVVHRDLKPQNVLLGEHGELYLADFGISRMLQGRTTITSTGAVLGTPQYMSPEQAQDSQVGPATDIYALGVMVYQWMTGVLPFDADTPYAVMYKHVNAPLAMDPLEPFPERSREVVGRALEKQSDQRWPSAGKFIEELAGALGVQEVPGQVLAAGKLPSSVAAAISARKLSRVPAAPTEYMGNAAGDTPPAGMRTPRSSTPTPRSGANPPVAPTMVQASASPDATTSRGRAVPPGGPGDDGGAAQGGGGSGGPVTPGELQFRPRTPPPPRKKMDPKLLGIGAGAALLLLLVLAWALAGSDDEAPPVDEAAVAAAQAPAAADAEAAPEESAEPPPLPAGDARLLMESDLACELSINGVRRGSLQAMTPLRLELAPGRYQLACTPPAHPDIVSSQVATVVREEPTVALFELKYEIEERERQRLAAERRKKEKAEAESQARQRQEDKEAAEARRLIEQARQREEDRVAEEERKLQEARNAAERRRREEALKLDEARRAAAARRAGGTPARTEVAPAPDAAEQARQAKARRDAEARRQAEAEEAARQAAAAQLAADAAAAAAAAPPPKRLTPIPVNTPQPSYPPDALRSGITGDVQVEITIGRDGQVKDVRILQARPRGSFEREVLSTVSTWRYQPLDEEVKLSRTFIFK